MMMSDLPQEDRFKLLALGIYMDGETGEGARPGAANLAMFGHHEETWKQLLRRTVAAGWLILRERGGSRKGPNGTRIKRASRYAASVPAEVYDRHREILGGPPFRAGSTKEASARPSNGGAALPSKDSTPTKEAQRTSFEPSDPVDNPPDATYEGSPDTYERSATTLPSTSTKEAPESTKEASDVYEGSADGLRRKRNGASPSISPSSHTSTSKIRSDLIGSTKEAGPAGELGDAVQDRKAARALTKDWPGVDDEIAAHIIRQVRADARRRNTPIRTMVGYLAGMHENGDLADYVGAALDHFRGRAVDREPPAEPEAPPLPPIDGDASSGDPTDTQPSLRAVPDGEPGPPAPCDENGIPAIAERNHLREHLARIAAARAEPQKGHGT